MTSSEDITPVISFVLVDAVARSLDGDLLMSGRRNRRIHYVNGQEGEAFPASKPLAPFVSQKGLERPISNARQRYKRDANERVNG